MFGENPIRKQRLTPDGSLVVQEIFPTLQGEGPYAGYPAIFVRLAGCNLRCWFCDTDFESGIDNPPLVPEQVVEQVNSYREKCQTRFIVLTGGEPFRQNILPFLNLCGESGLVVQIESAGTLWIPGVEEALRRYGHEIVCSPKTPILNKQFQRNCFFYKYVISCNEPVSEEDGLPYAVPQGKAVKYDDGKLITNHLLGATRKPVARPANKGDLVWVQACDDGLRDAAQQRCAHIAMKYGYFLSIQQHKILQLP